MTSVTKRPKLIGTILLGLTATIVAWTLLGKSTQTVDLYDLDRRMNMGDATVLGWRDSNTAIVSQAFSIYLYKLDTKEELAIAGLEKVLVTSRTMLSISEDTTRLLQLQSRPEKKVYFRLVNISDLENPFIEYDGEFKVVRPINSFFGTWRPASNTLIVHDLEGSKEYYEVNPKTGRVRLVQTPRVKPAQEVRTFLVGSHCIAMAQGNALQVYREGKHLTDLLRKQYTYISGISKAIVVALTRRETTKPSWFQVAGAKLGLTRPQKPREVLQLCLFRPGVEEPKAIAEASYAAGDYIDNVKWFPDGTAFSYETAKGTFLMKFRPQPSAAGTLEGCR